MRMPRVGLTRADLLHKQRLSSSTAWVARALTRELFHPSSLGGLREAS